MRTASRMSYDLVGKAIRASVSAHAHALQASAINTRIKAQRPAWRWQRAQAAELRSQSRAALMLAVQS